MTVKGIQAAIREIVAADEGYNQGRRTSFYNPDTLALIKHRATDCSQGCGWIAARAGYPIRLAGLYTGNFAARFAEAGFDVIDFESLDQVRAGDFVLTPGHHVVAALTAKIWWSAEFDERGKATGGKDGNQNGRETRLRSAYIRPGGWKYIVRPRAASTWKGRVLARFSAGNARGLASALAVLKLRAPHDGPAFETFIGTWNARNRGLSMAYTMSSVGKVPATRHAFVVLGSALKSDGAMTAKYERRLKLARTALRTFPGSKVIVSGGKPHGGITEAAAGAKWLTEHGIDASRIITEERSTSTVGNANYTVPVLREHKITRYTLVSDASHLRRASVLFDAAQLKVECDENVSLHLAPLKPLAFNDYGSKKVLTEGAVSVATRKIIAAEVASVLGLTAQFAAK